MRPQALPAAVLGLLLVPMGGWTSASRLRRVSTLARRLESLERSVAALDADTRKQFDQVYEAILGLMGSAPRRN